MSMLLAINRQELVHPLRVLGHEPQVVRPVD